MTRFPPHLRYQAYSPANSKNVIQWQWPSYDPITNAASPSLRCNGGRSAALEAPVAPGDEVSATWNQWTHSQGPIMVWMYKCAGEFAKCDGSGAGWFKIDEAGYHPKDGIFLDSEKPSGWDIAKLVGGNKSWTSKIPEGLAPGNYLIRHELIALHQANAPQFYAECAQITVSGTGTAQPDASYKTAIPGYCKQSDPNIRVSRQCALSACGICRRTNSAVLLRSPSTTTRCPRTTPSRARRSTRAPPPPPPPTLAPLPRRLRNSLHE